MADKSVSSLQAYQRANVEGEAMLTDSSVGLATPSNRAAASAISKLHRFHISICPTFDANGSANALAFTSTTWRGPSAAAHMPLLVLYTSMPNGTTQSYTASQLRASDDRGPLRIETTDEGRMRFYWGERATAGKVVIKFRATRVNVGPQTPIGGRYELRQDQGGLQFLGMSTIPIPWDGQVVTDIMYDTDVQWDLEGAPHGTRGVSSFGEGRVKRVSRVFDVWRTVFKVGPVNSWPSSVEENLYGFGFYWFGDLPDELSALPEMCEKVARKLAAFFRDEISIENPYRIFVRKVTPARGFGGTGGICSFVLDYDEDIGLVKQDDIFYLLLHEMVHGWPLMQSEEGNDLDLIAWYNEGVADYYASVLPYRFGLVSEAKYLRRINDKLTEYYTNPLRLTNNRETQDKAWTSPNLQTLSYTRGMTYLLQLDAQIRAASEGSKSVDDIILALLERRRKNQPHGILAWRELLAFIIGDSALRAFESMTRGELIRLPGCAFGSNFVMARFPQRELEFGFDTSSFFKKTVIGLRKDSEAAKAGIQDGDQIIWNTYVWQCQTHYGQRMVIETKRNSSEEGTRFEFWPRGKCFVESWNVSRACERTEDETFEDWECIDWIDVSDASTFQ